LKILDLALSTPKQTIPNVTVEIKNSEGNRDSELQHKVSDGLAARSENAFLKESNRWAYANGLSRISQRHRAIDRASKPELITPVLKDESPSSTGNQSPMRREIEEEVRAEIRVKMHQNHVKWAFAQMGVDVEDLMNWDVSSDESGKSYLDYDCVTSLNLR
jgi:hypothetical protein